MCAVAVVVMSGCIDSSYWLDPKSPLPRCFAIDSRVKGWKHPRIYYAIVDDHITADVWDGLFHHAHAVGTMVEPEPADGRFLLVRMNGVCDRYLFRYDLTHHEEWMYVAPRDGGSGKP
jgi:hypothetical protein